MARHFKMRRKGLRMQTMCENICKIFLFRIKELDIFKQMLLTFYGNITKKEKVIFLKSIKCVEHIL